MSEKITQTLLMNYCHELGFNLHTETNKNIFGKLIPDGWYISIPQHTLYIFEAKQKKSQHQEALNQLKQYITIASDYAKSNSLSIVPVFAFGVDILSCYAITNFEHPFETLFSDIYNIEDIQTLSDFNPHLFNQYIYDNFPVISSEDKMKIIVSTLLTISLNVQLSPPLALRCVEVENTYHMGEHFTHLVNPPYCKAVDECFRFFANIPRDNIADILFKCFVEISRWSFKLPTGRSEKKQIITDDGAVFTPLDIVQLMVEKLSIKPVDVVCDPCCGSGSFLYEALKRTKNVIGNELDPLRALITRHGLIISGINDSTERITINDYMSSTYTPTFDYLLMNPPYDRGNERDACLKFLQLARKGGAIIIPINNFRNDDFKRQLLELVEPVELIILNKKVFHPMATPQTCIFIFKSNPSTTINLKIYDFTNDGFEIKINHGRKFKSSQKPMLSRSITAIDDDWTSTQSIEHSTMNVQLLTTLRNELIKQHFEQEALNAINSSLSFGEQLTPATLKLPNVDISNIRWVKFSDIFEFINGHKTASKHEYPLFGATQDNKPQKYVNYYQYDSNDEYNPILSINSTGDGGCGIVHVMKGKFSTSSRYCFKTRSDISFDIDYQISSIFMSYYIHDVLKYNRNKGINKTTFNEELPIYATG